jgi:hypothetical protein
MLLPKILEKKNLSIDIFDNIYELFETSECDILFVNTSKASFQYSLRTIEEFGNI